jgi:hypothetical protein
MFLYQFCIEEWLKTNNYNPDLLEVVDGENDNLNITYNSEGIFISVEKQNSVVEETRRVIVSHKIEDKLLLEDFLKIMNEIKTKILREHDETEKELEDEHRELCNIEYAMDHC